MFSSFTIVDAGTVRNVEKADTIVNDNIDIVLKAGSHFFTDIETWQWDFGIAPTGRLRWYLYSPSGAISWYKDAEWHPIPNDNTIGRVYDPELVIPSGAEQGTWSLKLVIRGVFFGIIEKNMISYTFYVDESSITDHLFAPFVITFGGLPVVSWGEFCWVLYPPFWLLSPLWGLALFIIVLSIYKMSVKLALQEIKLGFAGIRKRFKKKGGKKNVKKIKVKKSAG